MNFNIHGQSDWQVIKSSQGWFIGWYQKEDDGQVTTYRQSGFYPCPQVASAVLGEVLTDQQKLAA